ncbi:MAG: membrane protein insertase YidC [Kofleriaceae bacterium]
MQDQGKRLLLAVALALGVMLVWNFIFPPAQEQKSPDTTAQGSGSAGSAAATPPPSTGPIVPSEIEAPRGAEERLSLAFPNFSVTFSSYGGNLVSFKLSDKRFDRDQTKGELISQEPDTGAFGVNFARSTYVLPKKSEWKGERVSDTSVKYTIETEHLSVTKTFRIDPANYLVHLHVSTTVKAPAGTEAVQNLAVSVFAFQDPLKIVSGTSQEGPRAWFSSTLRGEKIYHTAVANVIKAPREELGITWTGFEHPYLLTAYAPKVDVTSPVMKRTYAGDVKGVMRTDLLFGDQRIKDSRAVTYEVVGFLGPKNYTNLGAADDAAGFATNFKSTIDLGWFAFIGKPLLWLLLKFYSFFQNWGLAIMLLTLVVKAATLYWTTKSMRSMKAMAALAPQMKTLQGKYKDDKQRLQAETMALYKLHNVNPIAGCLPILLQMPIWLALYRMLSTAGELYQQPFIPGWIDDLTTTDPYYVLPVVLVVTMFIQARLTPATGDSRQQKFLQYGMPLMFGVMSFFFPAGLTLYIFTNTVLSALHSIYMNKWDKKSIAIVEKMKKAADEAAAKEAAAKAGKSVAKKVVDVKVDETDDESDDAESPAKPKVSVASGNPARPRKKKKRRK